MCSIIKQAFRNHHKTTVKFKKNKKGTHERITVIVVKNEHFVFIIQ